ncbi:MAG: spore maturation protein [Firmicutes bacterium]|nr:spore maturation protein [Bacillota bacterium]
MNTLSKIVIPLFVFFIVFYGFIKKVNLYDSFLEGAKEGLHISVNIFPNVLAMVFAINIFLDSNFVYEILRVFEGFLMKVNIPLDILPMAILRPISGTATLAIMNDIFMSYGPDSYAGRLASVLQGCTDTTIYVLALYFGSIGVKKIRYSLVVGLIADLIGITIAFILTAIFF